jgi:hypothetical protein
VCRLVNGVAKMGDYVMKKQVAEQPVVLEVPTTLETGFSIYTDDDADLLELPESEVSKWRKWLE